MGLPAKANSILPADLAGQLFPSAEREIVLGGVHPIIRARPQAPRLWYEHPDGDDDPQPDRFAAADMALTKRIAATIASHPVYKRYPGWEFITQHQRGGGVVQIRLQPFMGPINCFVVHIPDLEHDHGMRRILNACGEILERYRLSRVGFREEEFAKAWQAMPIFMRRHAPVPE